MCSVSVIIPTYKHRDFILESLDSVFAQTFTDYEIIVINDGSPDDTAEVLKPLVEAGRIRYIEQKNTGQSIARNRGIAEARGEFIALLDDDDFWPPDKLEWQVDAMARHPDADVIAGPAIWMDVSGHHYYRNHFAPEIFFEGIFTGSPFSSPGQTLIRTQTLRQVNGFNPTIWGTDDWDLWLRILKNGRIVMEDRDALFYRKHEGNASKNLCRMFDNCWRVLDIHLLDVADERRRSVALMAYIWLYSYMGRPILKSITQTAKSGEIRLLLAYFARLVKLAAQINKCFASFLLSDPVGARRLIRYSLPPRWSALLPTTKMIKNFIGIFSQPRSPASRG